MGEPALAELLEQVTAEARRNPARVRRVLRAALAAGPEPLEPIAVAERINAERFRAVVDDFISGSLRTDQVRERLGVTTVQAVHNLRRRGRVLGRTVGNATWFPAWQFHGGQLRLDLPRILDALGRYVGDDALAADRVMRVARDELGGVSLAAALDDPGLRDRVEVVLADLGAGH
jgi:hypothetical protein